MGTVHKRCFWWKKQCIQFNAFAEFSVTSEYVWVAMRKRPGPCFSGWCTWSRGRPWMRGSCIFQDERSPRNVSAGSIPSLTGYREENYFVGTGKPLKVSWLENKRRADGQEIVLSSKTVCLDYPVDLSSWYSKFPPPRLLFNFLKYF